MRTYPATSVTFRVEVVRKTPFADDAAIKDAIRQLGIQAPESYVASRLFFLQGRLSGAQVQRIASELLVDPVTETAIIAEVGAASATTATADTHTIEVVLIPGVTDPVADNLVHAAQHLGFDTLERAATGQSYRLCGQFAPHELQRLAIGLFSNPVIQRFVVDQSIEAPFVAAQPPDPTVEIIALRLADDAELLAISSTRRLALDIHEMQAIQAYYRAEDRDPTDIELETLAQTWSEHCVHKTFKALITYQDGASTEQVDGLLKSYIRAATEQVNRPWVRSAFVDNAGVIAFDDQWDLAFKVETHNHPSALEPFGGAHTGIGGVVRDILGISARPIANTNVLCFGPPDLSVSDLPDGVLHPQRIAAGVMHGVEDYGNKMGIPTVNGAVLFNKGYTSNPLVFCGSLGLMPRNSHPTEVHVGDLIVVLGGRTGRDGLRGATFSSMEIDQSTSAIAGSSVQIGHPIQEKQLLEVVLQARDAHLYHAITDCGAGGLASAVGEMGSKLGAQVELTQVPLKYPGLRPWEIWLSEAQERMVLAVPPAAWDALQAICASQDVEAVCIGRFDGQQRLTLRYNDQVVANLSMHFLHEGIPQRQLQALAPTTMDMPSEILLPDTDLAADLLALLAHPNIRSKESLIRRYDHEVQGGTAVKPLVGVANHGPGDAAVIVPLQTVKREDTAVRGVVLSAGICPEIGERDPYRMAWAAVDEAMRNAVCVGADPDQIALLDNFCWGKPTLPDRLGRLVRCAQGCYDAALAYQAPFISGKDSLNNEYIGADGRYHAIPGTLLISAVGIVPDARHTVTMDVKQADHLLYIVGDTRAELGGSHLHALYGVEGGVVPAPDLRAPERLRAMHHAIVAGYVQACHDCSEGGMAVALAEMCLAGRIGAQIDLAAIPAETTRDAELLFAESLCRFIVEVRPADAAAFEEQLADHPFARIGVTGGNQLHIRNATGQTIVELHVAALEQAWRGQPTPASVPTEIPMPTPPVAAKRNSVRRQKTGIHTPRVLILHANGTNRDHEAAFACELAGAQSEIVQINQLAAGTHHLGDYHMLVLPGGFSYGDDLGAGQLWGMYLRHRLGDDLAQFAASERPILGICNGFQALVRAGLLPGQLVAQRGQRAVTLTANESAQFECRWVHLKANPASPCIFTQGIDDLIFCPVAHGEGRVACADTDTLAAIVSGGLNALQYVDHTGQPAGYPANPNGSALGIAGLCNRSGTILGLMPHPEDHIVAWQHPQRHRGAIGQLGLRLFEEGVRYARC